MVVYAKSNPPQTLGEHTKALCNNLIILKEKYKSDIDKVQPSQFKTFFWKSLEIASKYHDVGKLHTPFQNKILEKLEKYKIENEVEDVPHNLLSPAFLKGVFEIENFPEEIKKAIYQSIAYHHNRGMDILLDPLNWKKIEKVINDDLKPNLHKINEDKDLRELINMPIEKLTPAYARFINPSSKINKNDGDLYIFFVLLKGLLHRLDHSASAYVNVEENKVENTKDKILTYLSNKHIPIKNVWQRCIIPDRNKNIVLVASTGIGKTEFALLWLGDNKGFYTLPVRTSVNAMYERLQETYSSKNIGLLHSDAYSYELEFNDEGLSDRLHRIDLSRQLSMPITVSTADQIFTATLKYYGYEKIYATLAYSKVIVDEIQAYDPEIVAIIIKGLEEMTKLGSRFCLITATLPPLYKNYLRKLKINCIYKEKLSKAVKHKVEIHDGPIEDYLQEIKKSYENDRRVLVIVNTVKKAQEIFDYLFNNGLPVYLLHSGFIFKDRRNKEDKISPKKGVPEEGIWITTQLTEVSLDLKKFPVLFTELSTIDSLIQRMGRILRDVDSRFVYKKKNPNIYIFSDASGIGSIYDEDIVKNTKELLEDRFNGKILSELDKQEAVKDIFDEEKILDTKYFKKFEKSIDILNLGFEVETKSEAQHMFRKISNFTVIPIQIFEENQKLIEDSISTIRKANSKEEKIKALSNLKLLSVSVPTYKLTNKIYPINDTDWYMTTLKYDNIRGLILDKSMENIF